MKEETKEKVSEALGWMYTEACSVMDQGKDIRTMEVPEVLERALRELKD